MMDFMIENWYMLFGLIALIFMTGLAIYSFFKKPTPEQMDNLREWLLGAVTKAEKELGGGTGQLKLRQVYDLFVARFPWLATVISFATFSDMVDDALVEMRELLDKNAAVQAYVTGDLNSTGTALVADTPQSDAEYSEEEGASR